MKNELQNTRDFLMDISDSINDFYALYFNGSSAWIFQVATKILVLIILFFLIDFSLKFLTKLVSTTFIKKEKRPFIHALFESKFLNSLVHVFALAICSFALNSLFYEGMHKITKGVLDKIVDVLQVIVIFGAALRFAGARRVVSFQRGI